MSQNNGFYVLYQIKNRKTVYSPLYIYSFRFLQPRKLTEAEKFNLQYPNPELITSTADKLKYYRYKKSLHQREVADYAEIERSTYITYENGERDYYPKDKLLKIAELLEIDVNYLLDDYNRFLFYGQGKYIKKLRKEKGLTQYELSKIMGVSCSAVKQWEQERTRMFKGTWENIIYLIEKFV